MTETKYGKYIKTELIRDIAHYTGQSILSHEGELDCECSMGYHCITKPMSFDHPHSHDFAEMLRLRYERPVEIELETDPVAPRSKAMEDVLAAMRVSVPVGSGHSRRIRSATGAV